MMRRVAAAAGTMLLLVVVGCNREEARRKEPEKLRAGRLEQELAKLQADFSGQKPLGLPDRENKGRHPSRDRLVPEWRDYHETLAACERDLAEIMEKVAARRIPEIAGPALRGWRRSSDLAAKATAKMGELGTDTATDSAVDRFVAQVRYYKALASLALVYSNVFLRPLGLLAQHGPRAERASAFEQLASEHPRTELPGRAASIALVLQAAWAGEDDPALKARMEQKLKELKLPLAH